MANHPDGLPNTEAFTVSTANVSNGYTAESSRRDTTVYGNDNEMSIGQEWDASLVDGETAVFEKFVGVTSTDHLNFPKFKAISESQKAYRDGWEKVLAEHTEAWNRLMTRNQMADYRDPITGKLHENDGVLETLQIEAVASRYYIMQNLFPDDGSGLNVDGASVGGLSSSAYGGVLFWDQDF